MFRCVGTATTVLKAMVALAKRRPEPQWLTPRGLWGTDALDRGTNPAGRKNASDLPMPLHPLARSCSSITLAPELLRRRFLGLSAVRFEGLADVGGLPCRDLIGDEDLVLWLAPFFRALIADHDEAAIQLHLRAHDLSRAFQDEGGGGDIHSTAEFV